MNIFSAGPFVKFKFRLRRAIRAAISEPLFSIPAPAKVLSSAVPCPRTKMTIKYSFNKKSQNNVRVKISPSKNNPHEFFVAILNITRNAFHSIETMIKLNQKLAALKIEPGPKAIKTLLTTKELFNTNNFRKRSF